MSKFAKTMIISIIGKFLFLFAHPLEKMAEVYEKTAELYEKIAQLQK